MNDTTLFTEAATQARYLTALKNSVYGFWAGKLNNSEFTVMFTDTVWTGLKAAWQEGAKRAGILPDEMTDVELKAMQANIYQQLSYIAGYAAFIDSQSKANGGKLASVMPRLGMWAARWREFENLGFLYAGQDEKLTWRLSSTVRKHCGSCVKLSGKCKRKSQWIAADIYPKHRDLECGGYACGCFQEPTPFAPLSKGKLPSLP